MNNEIKIAFAINKDFFYQQGACLASILTNSAKDDKFIFYILYSDIPKEQLKKYEKLKKIKDFSIKYIEVFEKDFEKYPINPSTHLKPATYYRLSLSNLLKEDKILYLDSDMIVLNSLMELYNTNIEGVYCAAIENFGRKNMVSERLKTLNINNYFNAGVLLLNLKKMREDDIFTKFISFIKKYPEKIRFADQCVLNANFSNNIKFLDAYWNFQHLPFLKDIEKKYKQNKNKVKILHFVSDKKPWLFNKDFEFIFMYYKYLFKFEKPVVLFKDLLSIANLKILTCIKNINLLIKLFFIIK